MQRLTDYYLYKQSALGTALSRLATGAKFVPSAAKAGGLSGAASAIKSTGKSVAKSLSSTEKAIGGGLAAGGVGGYLLGRSRK